MYNFLRHLLLPHHTNNFRAKILHYDAIVLVIFALISFSLFVRVGHRIGPDILGFATDIHVEKLLQLVNQRRSQAGLVPLKFDSQLSQAAAGKATDMFAKGYWAHTAPDGTTPWSFINKSGYVYTVAGENLAKNFSDSSGVVEAWMDSSSHRENILRREYQDIGFAVVNGVLDGEETTLVVQMFGTRLTEPVAQRGVEKPPLIVSEVAAETDTREPLAGTAGPLEATPVAVAPAVTPQPFRAAVIRPATQAVVKQPLIDISGVTKNTSLGIIVFMLAVLAVDAIYVWRRRIVRASGNHWAHISFLLGVSVLIWSMSVGSIL